MSFSKTKSLSLAQKLSVLISIALLTVLGLAGFLVSNWLSTRMEQHAVENMSRINQQVIDMVDAYASRLEREAAEQATMGIEAADQKLTGLGDLPFPPAALVELVALVEGKTISNSAAQTVFAEMFATGKSPAAIVQEKGLAQVSDTGAIEKFCDDVIAANPGPANDFRSGKVAALNFLKGQVMKLSKGKANPGMAGEVLERKLNP